MKLRYTLAASLLALAAPLAASPATAQSVEDGLHAGTLEVPLNKSQVVTADRPISKAMIGSPDIADVLPISNRSIYVLGKKSGTTSLTLYDASNRVIAIMDVSVGPDVESLRTQLKQMIPGNGIDVKLSNGSILLSGLVNDPGASARAAQLAKAYAGENVVNMIGMGASQQVMLEVKFAEVNRNFNRELGVRSTANSRNGTFGGVTGTGSQYAPGLTGSSTSGSTNSTNSSNNSSSTNGTSSNGTTSSTGATNGTANGTNLGLNGTTGITGSASDFTNLGTLNGRTFTGEGQAGAFGTTSSGTTGSSGTSSGSNLVGSVASAIGGSVLSTLATTTSSVSSLLQVGPIGEGFGIFRKQFNIGSLSIESVLNTLESRGLAKTLAEPTLIALSGEKASFLAGGEFPIPVIQNGGGGGNSITVEFKPFGVSLSFTPTVLGDKVINLVVEPEVSSIDASAAVNINGLFIPGLRTRRASTTLELRDGESFAIAGLLQRDFQTTVQQLPLLGSLPIIGALFRSSGFQKGETELMIIVTPRLVSPIRPEMVRLPTDRIDDPNASDVLIDGEGYRPKALRPITPSAPAGAAANSLAPATSAAPVSELPPAAALPSQQKGADYEL